MASLSRKQLSIRQEITNWLDAHAIAWEPCGPVASVNSMSSYRGQIYLDVPFDESDPAYDMLRNYLEKPDGSMAAKGVKFCYYPLSEAIKNAHHDEPGFWENWVNNF